MSRTGADSTTSNVAELQSLGCTFISRYTSEQSWALTLAEAQALSAAGIDIVSNYEHYTTDVGGGFNQGVTNANTALRVATACGMPAGRPIYFSVDEDVSVSACTAYFQGVVSVLGAARTGVYGSTAVCEGLKAAGLVTWTWRTMSTGWSGGAGTTSEFNVEQIYPPFNGTYDHNEAYTTDFGQWRIGVTPPPGPGGSGVTDQDVQGIWAYHSGDATGPADSPDVHQSLLTTRDNTHSLVTQVRSLVSELFALRAELAAIKSKVGA